MIRRASSAARRQRRVARGRGGHDVAALLESLGLQVGSVVVEHNGIALVRSEVQTATLADGDRLELARGQWTR